MQTNFAALAFLLVELCVTKVKQYKKQRTITLQLENGRSWFLSHKLHLIETFSPMKVHADILLLS